MLKEKPYMIIIITIGCVRCTRHLVKVYMHRLISSLQLSEVGGIILISQLRKARPNEKMLHPNIPF